jgi:hypothetical protein
MSGSVMLKGEAYAIRVLSAIINAARPRKYAFGSKF